MGKLLKLTRLVKSICLVLTLAFFTGCEKENNDPQSERVPVTITINTEVVYQTIAGFGGANKIWGTQFLKPAELKRAFGMDDNDLGMNILRIRLASDSTEWPNVLESALEAQGYGAKILASPWSPPAKLKSNNSTTGGYLLAENYEAFKDYINSFIAYMARNGVNIYAVSIQNEPDIQVSYESCDWTAASMIDFLKNYGQLIQGAKVAAPESYHFDTSITNAILNDEGAASNLDIVAGHIYGGGLGTFPVAEEKGKEIWMTEYLSNLNTGNSGSPSWTSYTEPERWEESLNVLSTIHEAMTNNWNAYIWWYIQRYYSFIGDGEQGTTSGEILKRGYGFSHFSKFIRPGYIRIGQSTDNTTSLKITAYEGDNKIVIVLINPTAIVYDAIFNVPSASSVTAYATSVHANREEQVADLSGNQVMLDLPGKSIITVMIER